uniref:Sulfotransferase domain-containing protein n=1 Tax=Anopheles coluzzii TaxID=1518534 RepID=A0A8W7PIU2_ANOCL
MSFEYTEITDPLFVENKGQTGEDDYIMVRAKLYSHVPIKIPNWTPQAHCYTTLFKQYEQELLEAEVYPDDVWVISYPKSGTTWTQEMVWLICNDLNFEAARAESLQIRFPFLDVSLIHPTDTSSFERAKNTPRPRFIKTHLPVSMLPKRYWEVKPKTIHIRRNPKSVAVSYFFHSQGIHYRGSMDTFLRSFVREHQFYSPYHAHVIEYHELQDCDNILYLSVSLIHPTDTSSFERAKNTPRPRFIKTHLPVSMLPKRYWEVKPKTIHIRRNPKSVAVSYFFHSQGIHYRGSMDTFLRSFVREHQFYSPYHAHVIEYHELQDCDNILYLSFEEMKHYLPSVVRKVCEFFGKTYSKPELELLYQHLSFKSMRDNPTVNYKSRDPTKKGEQFIRKGEAEGWKKEMTPEQIQLLDEWTKEKVPNPEQRKLFE